MHIYIYLQLRNIFYILYFFSIDLATFAAWKTWLPWETRQNFAADKMAQFPRCPCYVVKSECIFILLFLSLFSSKVFIDVKGNVLSNIRISLVILSIRKALIFLFIDHLIEHYLCNTIVTNCYKSPSADLNLWQVKIVASDVLKVHWSQL